VDDARRAARSENGGTGNESPLVLSGQEEYTNPHTGELELDTTDWQHRRVIHGTVILTDDEDADPNALPVANSDDFQHSPVRPRR